MYAGGDLIAHFIGKNIYENDVPMPSLSGNHDFTFVFVRTNKKEKRRKSGDF